MSTRKTLHRTSVHERERPQFFLPISDCISCFFPLDLVLALQWWVLSVVGVSIQLHTVCGSTGGPGRTTHLEAPGHQAATNTFQLCATLLPLRAETHLRFFVVIHTEKENTKIFAYYSARRPAQPLSLLAIRSPELVIWDILYPSDASL